FGRKAKMRQGMAQVAPPLRNRMPSVVESDRDVSKYRPGLQNAVRHPGLPGKIGRSGVEIQTRTPQLSRTIAPVKQGPVAGPTSSGAGMNQGCRSAQHFTAGRKRRDPGAPIPRKEDHF